MLVKSYSRRCWHTSYIPWPTFECTCSHWQVSHSSNASLSLTPCQPVDFLGTWAGQVRQSQWFNAMRRNSQSMSNRFSFPILHGAIPKHILQGTSERSWLDWALVAHSANQLLTHLHWLFSLPCLIFLAPSLALPGITFQINYLRLSPGLRVSFQENARLHSLNMVEPGSKSKQSNRTVYVLFHHLVLPQHSTFWSLWKHWSLAYTIQELKNSVSSDLVSKLHKLDQKSLGENNDCFITKRKSTFFIYKTTDMLQTQAHLCVIKPPHPESTVWCMSLRRPPSAVNASQFFKDAQCNKGTFDISTRWNIVDFVMHLCVSEPAI